MGRALFSKVPAAGPTQHVQLCLGWVWGLGTNTWEGPRGSATPLPLTCQTPGDASVSKIKLSSSCLLVLYCTSFACCYGENRTDSSSGGTTTVNTTTQANSLLNICSLRVLKARGSPAQWRTQVGCSTVTESKKSVSPEYNRPVKILQSRNSCNK